MSVRLRDILVQIFFYGVLHSVHKNVWILLKWSDEC